MPLDLSKLTDAVTKVATLASSVVSVAAERDAAVQAASAAKAELVQAQADVDSLTAQLVAAATTPAEAAGLTAVAAALAPAPVSPTQPAADPILYNGLPPVAVGVAGPVGVADTMARAAAAMAAHG